MQLLNIVLYGNLMSETATCFKSIIIVHKGALGDFLQTWPSLQALTYHWPKSQFLWAGRQSYSLWTKPLSISPCPWDLQKAVDALPARSTWPDKLQKYLIIWFGLHRSPCPKFDNSQFWFLSGLRQGEYLPPRELYLEQIHKRGIPTKKEWPRVWQRLISRHSPNLSIPKRILIFPGAGHPLKCWPLENYKQLAQWLSKKGYEVIFVLGPVEMERQIKVQNFKHVFCHSFEDLQAHLLKAGFVIGNDSGPLHLAGYLKVPGLALFGPTSPKQWGPYNLATLTLDLECSPCTQTASIDCKNPHCMLDISLDQVKERMSKILSNLNQ